MNLRSIVTVGAFATLAGLGSGLQAEPPEITLKIYSKEFIYFSDQTASISGYVPSETPSTPESEQPVVSSFSVSLKAWAIGIQDTPETKMQFLGSTYIIPSRKVVVPGPKPNGDGVFVESALDPNGSGNFEVLLIVNRLTKETNQHAFEYPSLDDTTLPKGIHASKLSSSSSTTSNRKELALTIILRNETGQPFVLKPEHFKSLPETKDWPLIEIPPIRPEA